MDDKNSGSQADSHSAGVGWPLGYKGSLMVSSRFHWPRSSEGSKE
jgi:hypothetical protein